MSRVYQSVPFSSLKSGNFELVPIRDEDKYAIMQWRNEQINILRQNSILSIADQENYFKNVIDPLFIHKNPKQLIFSFLESGQLIGLVHIDWEKKSAEVSFLTETCRNESAELFIEDWITYLELIKLLADRYLNFKNIFTYAYDIRPNLYIALEKSGFKETQRIKNGIEINNELKDIVIHHVYFSPLYMRLASKEDVDLYFNWANDLLVRELSFNQNQIDYDHHVKWFNSKINNPSYSFFLFENEKKEAVGQVRIETNKDETIIGISIDHKHRGVRYGVKMLLLACRDFFSHHPSIEIVAYIKQGNIASIRTFEKAGFKLASNIQIGGVESLRLLYNGKF